MMHHSRWPESLKDARPNNFKITKEDLLNMDHSPITPEHYVNIIIKDWMESITTGLERNVNPNVWLQYPSYFGRTVVFSNETFPMSIPIGFVLVSFFRSVYPTDCRIKEVNKIINYWLAYKEIRIDIFKCYKKGKFYISSDHRVDWRKAAAGEVPKELDGIEQSEFLYGAPQADILRGSGNS